jgi:hypothetical protein
MKLPSGLPVAPPKSPKSAIAFGEKLIINDRSITEFE